MESSGERCYSVSDIPKEIGWTLEKVSSFKAAYANSQKRNAKERSGMFKWRGYQFIPAYAKYLIELLDEKFNKSI